MRISRCRLFRPGSLARFSSPSKGFFPSSLPPFSFPPYPLFSVFSPTVLTSKSQIKQSVQVVKRKVLVSLPPEGVFLPLSLFLPLLSSIFLTYHCLTWLVFPLTPVNFTGLVRLFDYLLLTVFLAIDCLVLDCLFLTVPSFDF